MTKPGLLYRFGARFDAHLLRWCCAVAAALFCIAVVFKLNGSSVGMWRELLTEAAPARGLIFSAPKRIRVDEWGVLTPSMLSQARHNPPFPIENANLGAGRSPLIMNMPVAYYTTFFRPQFWGFFVFDFVRGFSFYWWTKFFGLLVASGWALRQIGVRSRLLVTFGAVWVLFSSYIQWWLSSPALLPEMLASWFICLGCAVSFLRDRHLGKIAVRLLGFVFFGINFVLCLYPPYQIPLVLLFIAVLAGVWCENVVQAQDVSLWRTFSLFAVGLAAIGLTLLPFWFEVRSTLEMVAQTVYPGTRRSNGGDLSIFQLFSGVIGFFENEHAYPAIYDNISEASNFYPLWPAALFAILAARARGRMGNSPLFVTLSIFLVGLSVYCIAPLPEWILRPTFLAFATERRALLALGIANILFCCLFLDRYRARILSSFSSTAGAISLWLAILALLWSAQTSSAAYFSDPWHWIQPLVISGVILSLFFWEQVRLRWLPVVLSLLLILSNAEINPVMHGISPLAESSAFKEIDKIRIGDPDGKWIVYHTRYFAQLVKATGATVFNGTKVVPDLPFLHRLDPNRAGESVYNRYANIGCELPRLSRDASASLVYFDYYIWFLPPDLAALSESGYHYILIPNEWPEAAACGFALLEKITPGDLWIYRRE